MMKCKSYAKANVFLKVVGKRGDYHEIISRFVRLDDLYDEISFVKKPSRTIGFELSGEFGCDVRDNTIYKAYKLLQNDFPRLINRFFDAHSIRVDKSIPEGSGLGGGSSNAAAFLLFVNKTALLNLPLETLCEYGAKIGADVNFFLHECKAANVSGIGEMVDIFDDDVPEFEIVQSGVHCKTSAVYAKFDESFSQNINAKKARALSLQSTREILSANSADELNDLLPSAVALYPQLREFADKKLYLSGSGGTFFKVK